MLRPFGIPPTNVPEMILDNVEDINNEPTLDFHDYLGTGETSKYIKIDGATVH